MATKIGGLVLTADTTGTVVTGGTSGGTYTVYFTNQSDSAATIQLGISAGTTFDSDYKLVESTSLGARSQTSFDPVVLDATINKILAESNVTGVNAVAMGFDED